MRRHKSIEMKKKKNYRYLLVPPLLSSPFLLPLCLLLFWLSWLFWSWPRFSGLLLLHPRSRRTLPRMLSSCHERGLKVSRWFKCNSWIRRLQTRKTGRVLTGDAFVGVLLFLVSAVLLHGVFGDGLHLNAGSMRQHAQILEQALPRRPTPGCI